MAFTKITHAGIGSTGTVLLENLEVTGVGTFGGSVSVGGTLTYEDVNECRFSRVNNCKKRYRSW